MSRLFPRRSTLSTATLCLFVLLRGGWSSGARGQDDPATDSGEGSPVEETADPQDTVVPVADDPPLRDVDLGETVITAGRGERLAVEIPVATSSLDIEDIRRKGASRTPDALAEEVGVLVQKSNLGGGSPIIRGRSGKSILLLVDGQRFNNSTFRRNNQYLNTLGLSVVERLEVVRGPASVLYGSDAMGGAVNVITRRREATGVDGVEGRFVGRYESASKGWLAHLGFEGEYGGTGFTAGFTRKVFDDLRAGTRGDPIRTAYDDGRVNPSGYDEYDLDFSLSHRISDTDLIDFLFIHTRQESVPRSDRLIANEKQPVPPDLRRDVDPQLLRYYELRWRHETPGETLESFTVTATLNNPVETRRRIKTSDPGNQINEKDSVLMPGLSAQFDLRPHPDHRLTTGFDVSWERIDSRRNTLDLAAGTLTDSPNGRYPDDSRYDSYGLYVQDEWEIADGWRWVNGVRYSQFRVQYDLDGLVVGPLGPFGSQSDTYDDVTFASALNHQIDAHNWVYGSISQGFRAPNMDDLAVLGDFSSGERVPNTDLDPESVWNFEIGAKHQEELWVGGADVSLAQYRNLFDNEAVFTTAGTTYFQVVNRSHARIVTLEAWFERVMIESDGESLEHSLFGNAFATWGRNTTDDDPVRRIPPAQALLGWRTEPVEGHWFFEAYARGALKQDRLAPSDKADPRIPIGGTHQWATFNLRGGWDVDEELRLNLALENIFDKGYRVHGSGIDAPGVNAVLGLDWRF